MHRHSNKSLFNNDITSIKKQNNNNNSNNMTGVDSVWEYVSYLVKKLHKVSIIINYIYYSI